MYVDFVLYSLGSCDSLVLGQSPSVPRGCSSLHLCVSRLCIFSLLISHMARRFYLIIKVFWARMDFEDWKNVIEFPRIIH